MTREDISLSIGEPDYAPWDDRQKMVEVIFQRPATKLVDDLNAGLHGDVIETIFAAEEGVISATMRHEGFGFCLSDLGDGSSQLRIYLYPTPEWDDILDGTSDPRDLSLSDMMNVVAAVKTFMRLLS